MEIDLIYESVDLLGFWLEIEAYEKNNHRHIFDISESRSSLTGGLFFSHYDDIGPKGSLQRAHLCKREPVLAISYTVIIEQ